MRKQKVREDQRFHLTFETQGTKMNKRILLAVAVASMFAAIPAAHAGTATGNFNVTVNLTSKCEITAGPADVAFTYTSFQTTAATGTGGAYSVRCTNTLPYSKTRRAHACTPITHSYRMPPSA